MFYDDSTADAVLLLNFSRQAADSRIKRLIVKK